MQVPEPQLDLAVTLSYAQTLDGRIATAGGSSQWISGHESLRYTHVLRARHDAIMVGVGTVLRDDPQLTVRLVDGENPLRVIVDSTLRTPPQARVLSAGGPGAVVAATPAASPERRRQLEHQGVEVMVLPAALGGGVDLRALAAALAARGVRSVMVEGGARLITSMLQRQLATHIAVCIAPKLLGSGIEAVGDLSVASLGQAVQIMHPRVTALGSDLFVEGELLYAEGER